MQHYRLVVVVPLEGTWIETISPREVLHCSPVVPLEGTWIEITVTKG